MNNTAPAGFFQLFHNTQSRNPARELAYVCTIR